MSETDARLWHLCAYLDQMVGWYERRMGSGDLYAQGRRDAYREVIREVHRWGMEQPKFVEIGAAPEAGSDE